jgi:hypothetical protein
VKKRRTRPPPTSKASNEGAFARAAARQARPAAQALVDSILSASPKTPQVPEPFRILGLPYPCLVDQLKARWRGVAFEHHPDRGGNVIEFMRLKAAYEQATRINEREMIAFQYPR